MKDSNQPTFWLQKAVNEINEAKPKGELIVSSGASPSGTYHIGHLREFLTADAIAWGLRQIGRDAKHVHVVDDFDRFRKVPANVPDDFEQYIGTPLYMVPAPDGSDQSYAEFFFNQIKEALDAMGAEWEILFAHDLYNAGEFAENIKTTLMRKDSIRDIIENVSGRQLPLKWSPIQILDDNNSLDNWQFDSINIESGTITYVDENGEKGEVDYGNGRVKLDWRVDWPSRWAHLGVDVEPFGRDHATKGGSYETGDHICRDIFGSPPPMPYPYEFINLKGQTKKMSASKGTGILPLEALSMMPPAALKDFVLGARPSLTLNFDTEQGFGRMYDGFSERMQNQEDGDVTRNKLAVAGINDPFMMTVPFNHVVVAYQSAQKDADKALKILERSEHKAAVANEEASIRIAFEKIDAWLENWAPEELKFIIQEEMPEVELTDAQKAMLKAVADKIADTDGDKDGQWFHEVVHGAREAQELSPKEGFQAIYRVLLGKDYGPKAGWFLSTFDPQWLVKRFNDAA